MRTSSFRQTLEGHRLNANQNQELKNKMTYQQLMNLNGDLMKQNQQLKNISNRLGSELQKLHTQFDIKPRQENVDLYNALNAHPILNKFQLTLIPLLETYELKIQQFQNNYTNISMQFNHLEKKYEEITLENQRLRALLTDKIAELIQTYTNKTSEKLGTDFSQMIFHQINEKQKILSEENSRIEKENVKLKAESQKTSKEILQLKKKVDEYSTRAKNIEGKNEKLQKQNKILKEDLFNLQTAKSQLDNQHKKIICDLERAQSQITYLNKHKQSLIKNIDRLRGSLEQKQNVQSNSAEISFHNKGKSTLQEAHPSDDHKKLFKLQKDYDGLLKEKNKLKDQIQQARLPLEEANEKIAQYKKRLQNVEDEKNRIEANDIKSKKMYEKIVQKSKEDAQRIKKEFERQVQYLKSSQNEQRERKNKRISQLEKELQKINIEKMYLQNQKQLYESNDKEDKKSLKGRDNSRQIQKLNDKIALNEQLFKEQIEIIENDCQYAKKQCEKLRADNKDKSQELRRMRQELEKTQKELVDVIQQKSVMTEQLKRIRNEYEGNLRDKQRLFQQKIKEIKMFVQQSQRRRKADKQRVTEASRQFKRVLEEIKSTYEERIKTLQNEQASRVRRNDY